MADADPTVQPADEAHVGGHVRTKERVTVRFDRDVLAYFRRTGRGYQTRLNAALRDHIEAHSRSK